MQCREFEKQIPFFLQNNMDYETMERFQQHMNSCDSCKEELSIQFLVSEGMKHLEKGDNFDLDAEFNYRIEASRKSHKRLGFVIGLGQWSMTAILFLIGAALIIIFG